MGEIKLIISDFDGTIADTFEANYLAYKEAFLEFGYKLDYQFYKRCFGLKYSDFMMKYGIVDSILQRQIKELKQFKYPDYFHLIKLNEVLLNFIIEFKSNGGLVSLATTANRINIQNVLNYLSLNDLFDLVVAGEDVSKGKPNPEIYIQSMNRLNIQPANTLIFEDSEVGIEAAIKSGGNVIIISQSYFDSK